MKPYWVFSFFALGGCYNLHSFDECEAEFLPVTVSEAKRLASDKLYVGKSVEFGPYFSGPDASLRRLQKHLTSLEYRTKFGPAWGSNAVTAQRLLSRSSIIGETRRLCGLAADTGTIFLSWKVPKMSPPFDAYGVIDGQRMSH